MLKMISISLLFGFVWLNGAAQPCACRPMLPVDLQPRGAEKNITRPSDKIRPQPIEIGDVYQWQEHYAHITNTIRWGPHAARSKRRKGTPEDSVYQLRGYMWFVEKVGFDCDLHIEIGALDSAATRIIVEVPARFPELQKRIKSRLDSLGLPVLGCTTKNRKEAHFKQGLPVVVTGYGFYDAFHKVNTNHGDAHTRKYIWEIHPVFDLVF